MQIRGFHSTLNFISYKLKVEQTFIRLEFHNRVIIIYILLFGNRQTTTILIFAVTLPQDLIHFSEISMQFKLIREKTFSNNLGISIMLKSLRLHSDLQITTETHKSS